MDLISLLLFMIGILLTTDFYKKNQKFKKNDPPGPISLPLLGNLHQLTNNPHRGLKALSDIYGGIFRCYLGDHYSIVISDISIINEIYVNHFQSFCSRPHNPTFKMFSGNYNDLAFADNYEKWKEIRSIVGGGFTKTKLIHSINGYIEEQTIQLINNMKQFAINEISFYPDKHYMKVSINVICKLFFSLQVLPDEDLDHCKMEKITVPIHKICRQLGAGHLDDFLYISSPLFYFSKLKYKKYIKSCTDLITTIYKDHLKNLDHENPKDLMDILILNLKDQDDYETTIVHTAFDFLLGGSDSSSGIMEWFTLFMINNRECQEKAYREITNEMGENCTFISYKDRSKLPYLNACINECLRLRTEDPLGIPRRAIEDIEINGYFIPKGSQIHHNLYAVGMNEKVFKNPYDFNPERWINCDATQLKRQHACLIPFSVGPRICIGKNLSELEIFVACANFILNFKFSIFGEKSNSLKKLCDIEDFGITIHPKPFAVNLELRSNFK